MQVLKRSIQVQAIQAIQMIIVFINNMEKKKMKKIMLMAAALCLAATTAYAADWNFYGSARVSTFVTDTDIINTAGAADTKTFAEDLQGNSRIGAKVKVSDELTARFEYGTGVNVRHLYGEWDFGPGTFLVGQTDTPFLIGYSGQVYGDDNTLAGQGGVDSGRDPMLQLTFGGFQIAAVRNNDTSDITGGTAIATEIDLPTIEAKYAFTFEALTMEIAGAYNSYELITANTSYDVDSWAIGLGAHVSFNAFWIGANVFTGENAGALMDIDTSGDLAADDGYAGFSGTNVLDNDATGFNICAGWKLNDMFEFEAGYGFVRTKLDSAPGLPSTDDDASAYYINAIVTLAPGVFFVPEIGRFDGEETGDTELTYYGIKWQIDF